MEKEEIENGNETPDEKRMREQLDKIIYQEGETVGFDPTLLPPLHYHA